LCILIAEPWDIGPGGYQLGNFPEPFLELSDRYRDDMRIFWRGDPGKLGTFAMRLAGSSDIYGRYGVAGTRSVNFIAAHDGFTLADLVAYERRHNEANGERNRDGHTENHSWNNGAEGRTEDAEILAARTSDARALLATLFASRGTIFLQAGDEFGRTQHGNNNAYAQDNETSWVNWLERDRELEDYAAHLAAIRRDWPHLQATSFFSGEPEPGVAFADVEWLRPDGMQMTGDDWEMPNATALLMVIAHPERAAGPRLAVAFNRSWHPLKIALPLRREFVWKSLIDGPRMSRQHAAIPARFVAFFGECKT
jgi:glycogen operon protein